tara:strand:- start:634 stop:783 length:150 start_codon:yes stop_codon:yes gene_type:complete
MGILSLTASEEKQGKIWVTKFAKLWIGFGVVNIKEIINRSRPRIIPSNK